MLKKLLYHFNRIGWLNFMHAFPLTSDFSVTGKLVGKMCDSLFGASCHMHCSKQFSIVAFLSAVRNIFAHYDGHI